MSYRRCRPRLAVAAAVGIAATAAPRPSVRPSVPRPTASKRRRRPRRSRAAAAASAAPRRPRRAPPMPRSRLRHRAPSVAPPPPSAAAAALRAASAAAAVAVPRRVPAPRFHPVQCHRQALLRLRHRRCAAPRRRRRPHAVTAAAVVAKEIFLERAASGGAAHGRAARGWTGAVLCPASSLGDGARSVVHCSMTAGALGRSGRTPLMSWFLQRVGRRAVRLREGAAAALRRDVQLRPTRRRWADSSLRAGARTHRSE